VAEPRFFANAAAFRRWLEKNAHRESELVVGFRKVGSGLPSLTWPESVDEALCFGWIDGVRHRIDDASYRIRFTPRKPGSIWSTINIAKVEALVAAGRMRPAGAEAFARRTERRSSVYSYEHAGEVALDAGEQRAFKANKAAWRWFEAAAPNYRKRMLFRVVMAKRPETRARRLAQLIAACAEGKVLR
jgi:uncharacterized protein YdeI (YjbR/CyaY-like superfamily)